MRSDYRGGGTGMVYKSMKERSWILTNAHVCKTLEQTGGVAETWKGNYPVERIQYSKQHDLCMAEVKVDLELNNKIASEAPEIGTEAIVAGHPRLLPLIINKGYTSDRQRIPVGTGEEPCVQEDYEDKETASLCLWGGGYKPIVTMYDSLLISNLIQPGSSGSPVYNSEGEVIAVVFAAANAAFSQGWCVPWEYVYMFVNDELAEDHFIDVD